MIYTFSANMSDIFFEGDIREYKNEKYGIISKNNTIEITFNQQLSEKMLNYFFQLYYEKDNYNLFIIHFKLRDSKYLKYIKYQLDEFHINNKEDDKKLFTFIIHIDKNYDIKQQEKEDGKIKSIKHLEKYQSNFLSFLSEYQQFTIDNLYEQRGISVITLYNKTNEELIALKELFDIHLIIKKEFSKQMVRFGLLEDENLILDKLDNLSENGIIDSIIKNLQNFIKNADNILRRFLVSFSKLNESDFINYFLEQIEFLIRDKVAILIQELGKNGFLVSCLFEKEISPKLKQTIINFIDNTNILNTNIKSEEQYDLDKYLLQMKIPGSKLLFENIKNLVKMCKNDILNIEDEYRKSKKKKTNDKEKIKTLEDIYYEKKNYVKNRLWNEELLKENIFSENYEDIMNDFFIYYFYNSNTKETINSKQKEFLRFIFSQKYENNNIDSFLYLCLWLESYHEPISRILEIFIILDKYFKPQGEKVENTITHHKQSFLESVKENYYKCRKTIEQNKKNDKDKEKQEEREKVNGIFYGLL